MRLDKLLLGQIDGTWRDVDMLVSVWVHTDKLKHLLQSAFCVVDEVLEVDDHDAVTVTAHTCAHQHIVSQGAYNVGRNLESLPSGLCTDQDSFKPPSCMTICDVSGCQNWATAEELC